MILKQIKRESNKIQQQQQRTNQLQGFEEIDQSSSTLLNNVLRFWFLPVFVFCLVDFQRLQLMEPVNHVSYTWAGSPPLQD